MIDSQIGRRAEPSMSGTLVNNRRHERFVRGLIWLPLIAFIVSLFVVALVAIGGSFSLSMIAPVIMAASLFLVSVPRSFFLESASKLVFEFSLLLTIVALSILSLMNSEEAIRSFRIIYPSLLPVAVFCHLVVVRYIRPDVLLLIPRLTLAAAFVFSVGTLAATMVLPPLEAKLFGSYRFRGFFENSIQHSIALATLMPIAVAEFTQARKMARKILWAAVVAALFYTSFRAGSKAALGFGMASGGVLYVILSLRSRNFRKIGIMIATVLLLGTVMYNWGLDIAEAINPIIAEKLRSIVEGGVSNYQSIESRKQLWDEAIDQGKRHWLIGTGAGEKVLGVTHSHNLVIDYFKGIGAFGAIAIVLLCLTILGRALIKTVSVFSPKSDINDIRILACYFSASVYVVCNQLSDCFGPSTIGFLWLPYLVGRLSEKSRRRNVVLDIFDTDRRQEGELSRDSPDNENEKI